MPMLPKCFADHPAAVGETYGQHMRTALSFARPLAIAAGAAFVHAFLPWLFVTTASRTVKSLHERMTRRCVACPAGRLHHPELFERSAMLGWDPAI
ncbi:hypothetical protein GCM10007036_28320 [Alsobacter metallidurans]|uniref:Capsule biosynthesis protein n=1 Tax=Alsobacter metallidurans TaxID=340221 RepID=A0A917I8L6_9HYPH|nr:DUF6356 family protein [Alsobacter metallidurans]GGH22928.1 hypothetical protein GCM10007036_28320 [Alsobacter metallidurans]